MNQKLIEMLQCIKSTVVANKNDLNNIPYTPFLNDIKAAIKLASKENKDVISSSWCVDDVLQQAKEDEVKLSRKQAKDILSRIEQHHDASIGINWTVISNHISMYIEDLDRGRIS